MQTTPRICMGPAGVSALKGIEPLTRSFRTATYRNFSAPTLNVSMRKIPNCIGPAPQLPEIRLIRRKLTRHA